MSLVSQKWHLLGLSSFLQGQCAWTLCVFSYLFSKNNPKEICPNESQAGKCGPWAGPESVGKPKLRISPSHRKKERLLIKGQGVRNWLTDCTWLHYSVFITETPWAPFPGWAGAMRPGEDTACTFTPKPPGSSLRPLVIPFQNDLSVPPALKVPWWPLAETFESGLSIGTKSKIRKDSFQAKKISHNSSVREFGNSLLLIFITYRKHLLR